MLFSPNGSVLNPKPPIEMNSFREDTINKVSSILNAGKHIVAFTGAGISAESGIPPFRGQDGLWKNYDPVNLNLNFYLSNPEKAWPVIYDIFYHHFTDTLPNQGHTILARWEKNIFLKTIITQNIDNLHQLAGSASVIPFHGNARQLMCTKCRSLLSDLKYLNKNQIPVCQKCGELLKPDFIFFGEEIPASVLNSAFEEAAKADVFLIIGTSGEIGPANQLPQTAKRNGADIIEINIDKSLYTNKLTDYFLQGKSAFLLPLLDSFLIQT